MISEKTVLQTLLTLKFHEYQNKQLDFLMGRLPGAYIFNLFFKPSKTYQYIRKILSTHSQDQVKQLLLKRSTSQLDHITHNVTEYVCSESFLLTSIETIQSSIPAGFSQLTALFSTTMKQNFTKSLANTLRPHIFRGVKSIVSEAIPKVAKCAAVIAQKNTCSLTDWAGYQISSLVSSGVCSVAGSYFLFDDEVSRAGICGVVVVANLGLWMSQSLKAASSKVDSDKLSAQIEQEYGEKLKNCLADTLTNLHNQWVPEAHQCNRVTYFETVPDDLIQKSIQMIVKAILAEMKIV